MVEVPAVVRPGRWGDLGEIVALDRRSQGAPHWGEAVYAAILEGAFRPEAEGGGMRRVLLVAETEGAMSGFAVASAAGGLMAEAVELESVVVAERRRRRGLGRALCEAVVGWAGEMGVWAVELEVRASSGAGDLYRGMGFRDVGRRRGYYRDPEEDAVLMRLEID